MPVNSFVQVPPQSTGKKIATEARAKLGVNQLSFFVAVGDSITGDTSGSTAIITGIETNNFGEQEAIFFLESRSGLFQDGESLVVSGSEIGVVDNSLVVQDEVDLQKSVIADPGNINYMQRINRHGAAFSTFNDGSPVFGPFSTLTVGEPIVIRNYTFQYTNNDHLFSDILNGTASCSRDALTSTCLMSVGSQAGDSVSRTTNFYHPYVPGVGMVVEMTTRFSDNGKDGLVRKWGYFDDRNGFYFELDGTDFSVVIRSSTGVSGDPVETRIPQSNFNGDRLDGTSAINFTLDTTTGNIFWIDFQWLGAGRVNFGVYEPDGTRLLVHSVENANVNSVYPYVETGSLPLRWEQYNTANTIGPSEFRFACASVKSAGKIEASGESYSDDSGIKTVSSGANNVPLFAIRPRQEYASVTNRTKICGMSAEIMNLSSDAVVKIQLLELSESSALTDADWNFAADNENSVAEVDSGATEIAINESTSIKKSQTYFVGPGQSISITKSNPDARHPMFQLFLSADAQKQPTAVVTAEVVSGSSADIIASLNWEERTT